LDKVVKKREDGQILLLLLNDDGRQKNTNLNHLDEQDPTQISCITRPTVDIRDPISRNYLVLLEQLLIGMDTPINFQ
jgi:hypothetical protein